MPDPRYRTYVQSRKAIDQFYHQEAARRERERRMQEAILQIKGKYGKNAILKVHSLEEGATARERNGTIGGHKA